MRLGLYGGSFDPIHHGHLRPVRRAREALELDRVVYLPTARPPHKTRAMTPVWARYAMVELALLHDPAMVVSTYEMRRDRPAYTVDTLERFRRREPGAELYLIVGSDSLHGLTGWRDWRRILELARIAVLTRPGWDAGELPAELRDALDPARLHRVRHEPLAISSTDLRRRLASSCDARELLPELVLDYIQKYDLYR